MARVLAVESVKGGVSKSTTTAYLGEALARAGRKTFVVDADPQGTLLEWEAAAAEAGRPFAARIEGMPSAVLLRRRLASTTVGYDTVLVDCPNRDVGIIEAALELADLAIVPLPPGVEELRRARAGLALASDAGVPARLLVTLVDSRTSLARQLLDVIDEEGLPRFATVVRRRADIANTVGASRPVLLHYYTYLADELKREEDLVPA
jgi:chromosome partitioning protein